MSDAEFDDGYLDGRDPTSPEPSANRSHRYRHSFMIGRREIAGKHLDYHTALRLAQEAEGKDRQL